MGKGNMDCAPDSKNEDKLPLHDVYAQYSEQMDLDSKDF